MGEFNMKKIINNGLLIIMALSFNISSVNAQKIAVGQIEVTVPSTAITPGASISTETCQGDVCISDVNKDKYIDQV